MSSNSSILVIYTGGTIGMVEDSATGTLNPFDFAHLTEQIPEIKKFKCQISSISFDPIIDSSNMTPEVWVRLAQLIEKHYEQYDGFVILHGSDTMAYTASALSFMLENLSKPVILTGSQLPIGMIRTDGKENFITAIEIAAAKKDGRAIVPEVCVYFEYQLYRGNRTHKFNAEHFEAFRSVNYPVLARAGVEIKYDFPSIHQPQEQEFRIFTSLDTNIAILKLFPGISPRVVESILGIPGLKALVMETYGSGNATTAPWFLEAIGKAIKNGLLICNITQCRGGAVQMGKYETGKGLQKLGVLSGYDMTTEAAVTKLMYLLGNNYSSDRLKKYFQTPLRGEMTVG
ncbi:MAG: asparaginase [Bacteroides sp.]|jgi:L-asparaginase|nr:asparaginase [Bacteroides sp.]